MNNIAKAHERAIQGLELDEKKAVTKIAREQKIKRKEAQAIFDAQEKEALEKKAEEERLAAEKAAADAAVAEEKAMANTRLLEEIRDLLKNK